jgi:hypothetical protein
VPAGRNSRESGATRKEPRYFKSPRALWWLHPRFAVLYMAIPLLILAYIIPEDSYWTLFKTRKYIDPDFLLAGLLIYAGFLVGSFFLVRAGTQSQERDVLMYCRWVVWPLFVLTILGYLVWFTSAMINAGGPGPLLNVLFGSLFAPEESTPYYYIKQELFRTIPGVTTWTQFGMLYATVEALLWVNRAVPRRTVLLRFLPLLSITLVRALLISERLALIEFLIPIGVVLLSRARWTMVRRSLVRFAPVLAGSAIFGLFAIGEYFRSWTTHYQYYYSGSYVQFAAERFLGYYATAMNNAAVHYHYGQVEPAAHTLSSLLTFPVLGNWIKAFYDSTFNIRQEPDLLKVYANPEFFNAPMVANLISDFSPLYAPIAAFFIGVVSFSIYKSFTRGRMIGMLLYPSWFVGLLEISRVYYWTGGRYFPVLAFLLVSLILFRLAKVPKKTELPMKRAPMKRVGARRWAGGIGYRRGEFET